MDLNEHLSVDHDLGPVEYTLQRAGTRNRSVHVILAKGGSNIILWDVRLGCIGNWAGISVCRRMNSSRTVCQLQHMLVLQRARSTETIAVTSVSASMLCWHP